MISLSYAQSLLLKGAITLGQFNVLAQGGSPGADLAALSPQDLGLLTNAQVQVATDSQAAPTTGAGYSFGMLFNPATTGWDRAPGSETNGLWVNVKQLPTVSPGQKAMAASTAVVIASDQSALPITGLPASLGQKAMAASTAVVIASDQSNLPTNLAQVGGAAVALGQAGMAASIPVAIANNQSNLPTNLMMVGGNNVVTGGVNGGFGVGGLAASGATAQGYPVLQGGTDGTNARSLLCDQFGTFQAGPPLQGAFNKTNTSAANGQATASQTAGGAGVKNVCTGFSAQLVGDGTGNADFATIYLRDGATGAGTVLASFRVALATGANAVGTPFSASGVWVGTAATAMTVEMSSAGATHTIGIVNMTGYQTK